MTKKLLAALCAAAMALIACTACGESASSGSPSPDSVSAEDATRPAETAAPVQSISTETAKTEDAVEAKAGDAFLAITDAQIYLQYWSRENDLLAYGAGVSHIDGNGSYKVSVTSDTAGARLAATGDPNGTLNASGIGFLGILIKDGASLIPEAVITVDQVTVDGKEIEMTAKNYTVREEGYLRTNICNPSISKPSGEAYSAEGALFIDGDNKQPAFAGAAAYSPNIADLSRIGIWKRIEVSFTVSGLPEHAGITAPQE